MRGHSTAGRRAFILARWVVALVALAAVALLAAPRPAQGFVSWSGIDPHVQIGGHTLDIFVRWPSQSTCNIQGSIGVNVGVPGGNGSLISESSGTFTCGSGETTISTVTTLDAARVRGNSPDRVEVSVTVNASSQFPVKVDLTWDGKQIKTLSGTTNEPVQGHFGVNS